MNKNYGISAPTGVRSEAELKRLQAMLRPRAATGVWSQEDQSAYDAYLKKEAADPLSYRVYGYEPPAMVSNRARVESMQDILGVKVDGLWGPQTQAAYDARRQEEAALRTQQARGERGLVPLQGGVDDGYVSAVPEGPMIPNRVYAERDKAAALAKQYRGTLGSTTLQGGIDDNYVSAVPEGPMIPNRVKAGDTPTLVEKVYQGLLGVAQQKSGEAGRMAMNEERTEREENSFIMSPAEIAARYDPKIASAEAAYRNFNMTGVNTHTPEGRAKMQKRKELYDAWRELVRNKEATISEAYGRLYAAAYAESPEKLIGIALQDAKQFLWGNSYAKDNYPQDAPIGNVDAIFQSEDELFTYSGSLLNYLTKYSGQEHMCPIYVVIRSNGAKEYVMGTVSTGETGNVIDPYVDSVKAAKTNESRLSAMYGGVPVRYLGILHSHPGRGTDNNSEFSAGDGLVAAISGKIWLTTEDGSMYALDRGQGLPIILPGAVRDGIVMFQKALNDLKIPWPSWLTDRQAFVQQHDARTNGANFEVIGAKSYDARNMP